MQSNLAVTDIRSGAPDIPRYRVWVSAGAPTLYVFPHAGGSAQYYVPFAKAFSTGIKCVAVQYPGRGGTHDLGSFTSIPRLAEQMCDMLSPAMLTGNTMAFFGHSMGALVAFDAARRIEAAGHTISALFVSACAAPGQSGYQHLPATDRGLLDTVGTMTGANPEFLENEDFAARILPTLRGLRAIANYECAPDATVSCPISAFLGDDDEVATYEKVAPWSQRTMSDFSARVFTGQHFYLENHLAELAGDIEAQILSRCAR